jgi:hypothetical protein
MLGSIRFSLHGRGFSVIRPRTCACSAAPNATLPLPHFTSPPHVRPAPSEFRLCTCQTHDKPARMSTAARRRLMRDFKVRHSYACDYATAPYRHPHRIGLTRVSQRMQTDPPAGVSASPIADNVMTWYDPLPSPRTRHVSVPLPDLMTIYRTNVFRGHGALKTMRPSADFAQERSHNRACRYSL